MPHRRYIVSQDGDTNIRNINDFLRVYAIIYLMDSVVAARKPGDGVGPD